MGVFGSQGLADTRPVGTKGLVVPPPPALPVQRLRRKLQEAARKILRLRLEREQLLELGNRLRAELGRPTGEPAWDQPGKWGEGGRENRGALVEGNAVRSRHSVAWPRTGVREPAGWQHG